MPGDADRRRAATGNEQFLLRRYEGGKFSPVPAELVQAGLEAAAAHGACVGLIHDLPGAGEVVREIVREARAVLAALPSRVQTD